MNASQPVMRRSEVRRRRRDVFLTLLGAVGVTLVLAVGLGGSVWVLHLLVDVVFAGYVMMLISIQQQSMQAEEKVRYLRPAPQRRPEPLRQLARSGS